ncbi:response regulator [Haloferax mediterranei ATCC 33500]|uniref:histidine kinase n=1 Tax=Haloferax mediterranei (strain ATCC 33500 / DSM 1411 / JCM 8866 / NBRC 14739 / NCIMB 2177 / R-4) TaxID=523841 RepID=I3R4B7_HALMT|nr:response regulator [Haloferax mediterranei]AFK19077.1 HTR-like protein [Haloferax mediterranei ATCC 33500]AHZ21562.1 HTR-like protein [Haloferax mediterranei ATCC 33500]EMA04024.1 HTR-like protein [Haloferax mediterranei ATCC 33500]MDX5989170.1 response regulator [Haloferax mediterranei ATCC 33500]QCQ75551.1 response regulator [Haloferax mediterranei ATCC 33500]
MTHGETDHVTILHVDDDPAFAQLVAINLERRIEGANVETYERGTAVLDQLATGGVDCIVSDYQMPEMTGVELLETVREQYDVPFVLFTGHGSEEVASDAISAGVTDYVQKNTGDDQWLLLANRVERAVREHRALAAREEADRRFSTLIEAMPGVAYRSPLDPGWPISFVSEGCLELTGYEREALESGDISWGGDVVHPNDRGGGWDEIVDAVEAGERYKRTYRIQTRTGETKWVREHGLGVTEDGEVAAVEGYVYDVTEKHHRRMELREKESLLDSLFESVPIHLFVKDEAARHVRVSSALVDDPDALVGKTDLELSTLPEFEHHKQAFADDCRVLETNEAIIDKEEYLPDLDRWNLTSKVPWTDDDGNVVGIIGTTLDITERKRQEQEIIRQNKRLGEFASIVSHDLKGPLNVAQGNLELVREETETENERLDTVADALERIGDIVDDVLSMARGGANDLERDNVDLEEAVVEAWRSIDATETDATLETPDRLGTIHCDRVRLVRLLENLFWNAVEHGSTGPTITVRRLQDDVGFAVIDDGPGIPEESREHVFERGYSTDEDGTGYGLSIVADIAEAHGWNPRVRTANGGGARIEIVTRDGLAQAETAQSNSTSDD